MMENDAPGREPFRPQAANDNKGASAAPIDARILTIARALGRQIAREQLKRMRAANDNDRPETMTSQLQPLPRGQR
ncbi:MAG TPA: hypothetical protein VFZ16_00685 [Hyphomicrobiaceae bacterium]|nr:hypothetical protein [Hyphomicrobiaceae bacterium]